MFTNYTICQDDHAVSSLLAGPTHVVFDGCHQGCCNICAVLSCNEMKGASQGDLHTEDGAFKELSCSRGFGSRTNGHAFRSTTTQPPPHRVLLPLAIPHSVQSLDPVVSHAAAVETQRPSYLPDSTSTCQQRLPQQRSPSTQRSQSHILFPSPYILPALPTPFFPTSSKVYPMIVLPSHSPSPRRKFSQI